MVRDQYPILNQLPFRVGTACLQPSSYTPVTLDSPAINVMTDFQVVAPAMVPVDASLLLAHTIMVSRNVRLLFVTDADQSILGVITSHDIQGERPITHIHDRGVKHHELLIGDLMTPIAKLFVLDMAEVLHAKVGSILQTLRQQGRQHAIVIEREVQKGKDQVRGIFSAIAIGRRLGVPVQIFEVANTFAEIEEALAAS